MTVDLPSQSEWQRSIIQLCAGGDHHTRRRDSGTSQSTILRPENPPDPEAGDHIVGTVYRNSVPRAWGTELLTTYMAAAIS